MDTVSQKSLLFLVEHYHWLWVDRQSLVGYLHKLRICPRQNMSQSQTLSERQAVANAAGPEVLTAYVQDGHSMCITHDMRYDIVYTAFHQWIRYIFGTLHIFALCFSEDPDRFSVWGRPISARGGLCQDGWVPFGACNLASGLTMLWAQLRFWLRQPSFC